MFKTDEQLAQAVEQLGRMHRALTALVRGLRGLQYAKDILVVKESDFEQHRDNPYLVYHTAHNGKGVPATGQRAAQEAALHRVPQDQLLVH